MLAGPAVLGLVAPSDGLEVVAELVVFLLFWVGLETRITELARVGRPAALAGALGELFAVIVGMSVVIVPPVLRALARPQPAAQSAA